MNCKNCEKKIDMLEVFSGDLCLKCYELEYEKMSNEEKEPSFNYKLINKNDNN